MIPRIILETAVLVALKENPVVAIVGPRQCGKTTLARQIANHRKGAVEFFDLEDSVDLARLENPRLALEDLDGLVVIDEFQKLPELFQTLRVLVDQPRRKTRFLVLGSASPHLVRGLSESLAGRIAFIEQGGFELAETGAESFRKLWLRGGFPRSFLPAAERRSFSWRQDFIKTFLERDIPQLGISIPATTLRRFWTMAAHYHGQVWNAAEFARSLSTSESTARRYLDLLAGTFVLRQLQPWFENVGKRQVKAPKIYVRDTGLLHALLGLESHRDLSRHPKFGASWEGFALEQVLALARPADAYFWATHGGAELDLFFLLKGKRIGFEFKCADAPTMTSSIRSALESLRLDDLFVVHPGRRSYRLGSAVEVVSVRELPDRFGR